jgi:23S rRNA (adenine1618-N6)-methyltransferase
MKNSTSSSNEKGVLHHRNKHNSRYDFDALTKTSPDLLAFVAINKYGDQSIDFANPHAVKALNKALLKHFYQIDFWDIPEGYLCPPIPGRADYMHYAADLLSSCNQHHIPKGKMVKVLDIGVGANCIYPIIGCKEYGWTFVGSEIDEVAVRCAKNIAEINSGLKNAIQIRLQTDKSSIFKNIFHQGERFDLTVCNPPFHASAKAALEGSQRKNRNLGNKDYAKPTLNFGGLNNELWTDGGEVAFVGKMIAESKLYKNQCFWFTSLVSKSENLDPIYAMLRRADVVEIRTSEMRTGNKISRIVAWTFLNEKQQEDWVKNW